MTYWWLYALGAYIIGSVPCGYLIGRIGYGVDLKTCGSGNIGATNAYRELGAKAGVSVFLCDFLKGAMAVGLGAGHEITVLICALFVVVGNNWSVFLGFKSGKGVACGVGAFTCICPEATGVAFLVWLWLFWRKRIVSLASIVAVPVVPLVMWAVGEPFSYVAFGIFAAGIVIYKHQENIGRLIRGEEKPLSREEK